MQTLNAVTCRKNECYIPENRERKINCIRGLLWITCFDCSDDFILKAGDSLDIECMHWVVVQALEESEFVFQ